MCFLFWFEKVIIKNYTHQHKAKGQKPGEHFANTMKTKGVRKMKIIPQSPHIADMQENLRTKSVRTKKMKCDK